jgi:hypothetical protein
MITNTANATITKHTPTKQAKSISNILNSFYASFFIMATTELEK